MRKTERKARFLKAILIREIIQSKLKEPARVCFMSGVLVWSKGPQSHDVSELLTRPVLVGTVGRLGGSLNINSTATLG